MTAHGPANSVARWPAPRLRALQVQELFRFAAPSAAYSFVGSLLTLGVLFESGADRRAATLWFMLATTVAFFRALVIFFYRRREPGGDLARWPRLVIAGNLAAGMLWGALGTLLFPAGPLYAQLLVLMVIICFVAGSVTAYAPVRFAHDALSLPATIPTAVYLFFVRDGVHVYAGVAALLFCAAIVYYARQLHAHLEASFLAQIERDDLLSISHAVREKVQLENRDLAHRVAVRGVRAESAANRAERLETLFEHSPLPQFDCDAAGTIVAVNAAAARLLGATAGELAGKPLADFVPGVVAETTAHSQRAEAKRPGGAAFACTASVTPFALASGVRGFSVVLSGLPSVAAVE